PEFHVVGRAENRMKGWTLARKHDPGAAIESWPQHRMGQIRPRFIDGADAVKPGRRGSSETAQLRKDEPHPVGPLPARSQFGEHGLEDRRLRCHEVLQIKAIRGGHPASPFSEVAPGPMMRLLAP